MTDGQAAGEAVAVEGLGRRNAVGTSWYEVEMALVAALAGAVAVVAAAACGDADEGC